MTVGDDTFTFGERDGKKEEAWRAKRSETLGFGPGSSDIECVADAIVGWRNDTIVALRFVTQHASRNRRHAARGDSRRSLFTHGVSFRRNASSADRLLCGGTF
ncbi:hypothetical protein WS70_19635 [Burkholderia mayonis]|uniref:Uncharacterized protein n=1 Tax=Burkholderia mayonis TaxID=1385591 RepID=A0A1B4FK95_9BURK|nr:hypothetical protein WS70_19635 [Burkholderia mayonis]KVE46116.1 hypothetical protein WS70_02965 [Burkholderia mayonis]